MRPTAAWADTNGFLNNTRKEVKRIMTGSSTQPNLTDPDEAVRNRVLERVKAINGKLLARLETVADDLDAGGHLAALGGLDGIEREVERMRSFLLLLR